MIVPQMMGHLLAVKEKQTYTDDMFTPLRATLELLKTYGQDMSEEVHLQLQVWINKFA
jgi:dynein heavy chain